MVLLTFGVVDFWRGVNFGQGFYGQLAASPSLLEDMLTHMPSLENRLCTRLNTTGYAHAHPSLENRLPASIILDP